MNTQGRAFRPIAATQNTAVTNSNAAITLSPVSVATRQLRIANIGTETVFIRFGTAATTAAGIPMVPNSVEIYTIKDETTVNVIAAVGGSNTLYVTIGEGL